MRTAPARHASPATWLLAGALVPIAIAGAVCVVAATAVSTRATVGALVGTGVAAVAFGLPPALMRMAKNWSPPAVMAGALMGYLLVVGFGGVVYVALGSRSWLSSAAVGWTLLAGTVASSAGMVIASRRMRLPIFDRPAAPAPHDQRQAGGAEPGGR